MTWTSLLTMILLSRIISVLSEKNQNETPDIEHLKKKLQAIADDFLLGKDNTLGKNKPRLEKALPITH